MTTRAWGATFDPDETKDYTVDWSAELAAVTDTLASATFSVAASWTTAGLVLENTTWDTTRATVWVRVTDPSTQRAGLIGQTIPVTCTVTTTGGRTLQQTVQLSVAEK